MRKFMRSFAWLNIIGQILFPLSVTFMPVSVSAKTEAVGKQEQNVARIASQAGEFLANIPNSDAAASMAKGVVTNAVGNEIQEWLSRFGTARIQLDVDKHFSLKNSQFDFLAPLYDQEDNVVFTQWSLHRTDDRTQSNLGFGIRHFAPDYMLGGNVFGDYDFSRDHARAGIGTEYWRDFLKFGFNGYIGLTGWRDSPDINNYEERPANGWDIRSQAWLPQLPQLGGKLIYEQYYGKEVALFGKNNRQRNPYAITTGIEYTPVPLITISGEQRQGQSGKNDTRFGIDLNLQLGTPWSHQIAPEMVASMRSLAGSRYDLVERNNNIVLEYRQKQIISLRSAEMVTGFAGERKSLGISVTSTHGLSHIDWSAPTLLAAGGKIEQIGNEWSVVLPAYQSAAQTTNAYTVNAVAVDKKGNRSDRSETTVTVQPAIISKENSSFTPVSSSLPADGISSQELILTIKDNQGQNVETELSDIILDTGTLKSARVSAPERKDIGVYTVTITAGRDQETVKITPKVRNTQFSSAEVIISTITPAETTSLISTNAPNYISGGDKIVTVTLKDEAGNTIRGQSALLTSNTVTVPNAEPKSGNTWQDNGNGTYSAVYTVGPVGSNLQATLKLNHWTDSVSSEAYAIAPSAPVAPHSSIATNAQSYSAGEDMTVTVTLKDMAGNTVNDQAALLTGSAITVANATLKSGSNWQANGNGTYRAVYTAGSVGTNLQATLQLNHWTNSVSSEAYAIAPSAPVAPHSSIATNAQSYSAGEDITVTVILKDMAGNAVNDQAALLTGSAITVANATLKSGSNWQTNGNGTYRAVYTAGSAGTNLQATLQLNHWTGSVSSEVYSITSSAPTELQSSITTDKQNYAAGTDITVTIKLKDIAENPVDGQAELLNNETVTVENAVLKSGNSWQSSGNGSYRAVFTAMTAGTNLQAQLMLADWANSAKSSKYAITLVTGTAEVKSSQSVVFYPRTISVNFKPDDGYIFDKTCLTVSGIAYYGNSEKLGTKVTKWGDTDLNYDTVGKYSWKLTISNKCGYPVSGTVMTQLLRINNKSPIESVHVKIDGKGA